MWLIGYNHTLKGAPCDCVPQDRPYLLAHMSPSLVADVAAHTQARWLEAAPLLRGLPPALIVDLALRLGTRSFSPDEVNALGRLQSEPKMRRRVPRLRCP